MVTPSTQGRSVGDLELVGGKWYILHRPIGSGVPAQWVYDQNVHDFLRNQGITRVEGSGDNMKLYGEEDDRTPILDLSNQQDLNTFAGLYQGVVGPQDVATSAYEQGAPVDLERLWNEVYGPGIPFPDTSAVDEFGQPIRNQETNQIVPDIQKYNQVIDALESRVGSLSRYGLDRDADYQLIDLGDQYESDIVISGGKVTKINKTTGAESAAYTPGIREDISAQMPGYDVLQQPTGQLSAVEQRVDPGYIIDPKTMQPYFQQPDGSLQAAPTPSVDDQISMHLVEGNMDAAVSKANFRDRPTSLEYFNAAMDWARNPADIFTISAIVRGVFEPTPGPMGELRRVGAPPAWATQAWVGLQNSMGIPASSITATPNAELGSANPELISASSSIVGTSFSPVNSASITSDGGKTVTVAPQDIRPDTVIEAKDASGNPVGSMTADMAVSEGFEFEGVDTFEASMQQAMQDTGFQFEDVRGLSDEEIASVLDTITSQEQRDLINQIFQDQGGLANAGAFFDSIEGFTNAINFHLGARGWPLVGEGALDWDSASGETVYDDGQGGKTNVAPAGEVQEFEELLSDDRLTDEQRAWLLDQDRASSLLGAEDIDSDIYESPFDIDAPIDITEEGGFETTSDDIAIGYTESGTPFSSQHQELAGSMGISVEELLGEPPPTPLLDYGGGDDFLQASGPARSFEEILAESLNRDFQYGGVIDADADMPAYEARGAPIYSEAKYGYDLDNNLIVTEPSKLIGYESIQRPGQAELDVIAGRLPFEEALGSYGPASYGDREVDVWQTGVLGEKRNLPFTDSPLPPEISGYDIFQSEDDSSPTFAEMDSLGGSLAWDEPDPEPLFYNLEADPDPDPEPFDSGQFFYQEPEPFDPGEFFYQEPEPVEVFEPPEDWGAPVPEDPEDYAGRWYDEGAKGTRTGDRFTLVGEEGPELALFPRGTEIVPLNRPAKPKQRRRLRNNFADAIDSFAFGGFSNGGPALVGEMGPELVDLPPGAQVMPAGITEMMTGRPTRAPRSLFRQAGMRAPSAQTIGNLLPEEIEVYQEMGRLAGIPEKAFEREFRSMVPMGQGGTRQARFTPRGTGRTRYGSI